MKTIGDFDLTKTYTNFVPNSLNPQVLNRNGYKSYKKFDEQDKKVKDIIKNYFGHCLSFLAKKTTHFKLQITQGLIKATFFQVVTNKKIWACIVVGSIVFAHRYFAKIGVANDSTLSKNDSSSFEKNNGKISKVNGLISLIIVTDLFFAHLIYLIHSQSKILSEVGTSIQKFTSK